MRLTRRGWTAVAVFVLALVLAWRFGARSLNAVAAPLLAALLVGAVSVRRADPPSTELSAVPPGFQDETRQLSVSVDGDGLATATVSLPDGVAVDRSAVTVRLPHTLEYTLHLKERGAYTLGPVTVAQRGPLGFVEDRFVTTDTARLVVYPRPYNLPGVTSLLSQFDTGFATEPGEFDHLREYRPDDAFRRIHWKSSAKRDELFVLSYAPVDREQAVTVVATSTRSCADEMATAAITVVESLLDAGFSVALVLPSERLPPGRGADHREAVRRSLAVADSGLVSRTDEEAADITIDARTSATTVRAGGQSAALESLVGRPVQTPSVEANA